MGDSREMIKFCCLDCACKHIEHLARQIVALREDIKEMIEDAGNTSRVCRTGASALAATQPVEGE